MMEERDGMGAAIHVEGSEGSKEREGDGEFGRLRGPEFDGGDLLDGEFDFEGPVQCRNEGYRSAVRFKEGIDVSEDERRGGEGRDEERRTHRTRSASPDV